MSLRAPFPWFGGKRSVGPIVWERFGNVANYVEPFAGSLAVLLARPHLPKVETVNDLDCYLANFWRAVQAQPEAVAEWADWPVNEADLHARHLWLVGREEFRARMMADPDYFDAKVAGWWVWGICSWIGSGWCARPEWSGRINAADKARGLQTARNPRNAGLHVWKKRPALRRGGRGVAGNGLSQQIPQLGGDSGAAGRGVSASAKSPDAILDWMQALAVRLRKVRVCCGEWARVLGRCSTECIGTTAVFLDPPYGEGRDKGCYVHDDLGLAARVRTWALENGSNPNLRIALCGYEGEHAMPPEWACVPWKANGGYGNTGKGRGRANAKRERIWFSPHCLAPALPDLFTHAERTAA